MYLVCENGRRGCELCHWRSARYDEVERLVLDFCTDLRPEEILPSPKEQASKVSALRTRLLGYDAELKEIEKQLDNLTDQIATTSDAGMRKRYEAKGVQLQERQREIGDLRLADKQALADAEKGKEGVKEWQTNLATLKAKLSGEDPELRQRMRAHLRELIDRIEIFTDGLAEKPKPPLAKMPKEYHGFLRWIAELRATRKGRFLRIHFKSGSVLDVAPLDAIPQHGCEPMKGISGEWSFRSERERELFRRFQKDCR